METDLDNVVWNKTKTIQDAIKAKEESEKFHFPSFATILIWVTLILQLLGVVWALNYFHVIRIPFIGA